MYGYIVDRCVGVGAWLHGCMGVVWAYGCTDGCTGAVEWVGVQVNGCIVDMCVGVEVHGYMRECLGI